MDKLLADTPDELFEELTGMPKMTVQFAREMGAALGGPDDSTTLPSATSTEAPVLPTMPSVVGRDDSPPPPLHPVPDSGAVGGPPGPAAESQGRGRKPLHEDFEALQRKVAVRLFFCINLYFLKFYFLRKMKSNIFFRKLNIFLFLFTGSAAAF